MRQRAPHIVFLTSHLPFPLYSGGRRRDFELIRRLSATFNIHLCVGSKTYEEDRANADRLREFCETVDVFRKQGPPSPDNPDLATLPAQVIDNHCPPLSRRVLQLVYEEPIELIHAEGFFMMQHVPARCEVPTFLVEQNIEYLLWRQRAKTAPDKQQRSQAFFEYLKTLEAEIETWYRSDLMGVLTDDDRKAVRAAAPGLDVRLVPDGADHLRETEADKSVSLPRRARNLAVFVANFAYGPNADAAVYLCSEILPRMTALGRDTELWLVGNHPPDEVRALAAKHPNVVVTGSVPSVVPYLDAADVVLCPLRIGGGIKVKVLEALVRGKAVVTTSVGIQGFGPGFDAAVVADDPVTFARAANRLLASPVRRRAFERRALAFSRTLPSWDDAARQLAGCYWEVLERAGARPSPLDQPIP